MSISYPLSPPSTPGPATTHFRAITVAGMTESVFTLQQQIFEWPGDRWELEVALPPMRRDLAAAWIAFLAALRGRVGSFYWGPHGAEKTPRGTAGGTPVVNGANQSGKTLLLSGWTGTLKAGDWIQVNHPDAARLYQCLQDVAAVSAVDVYPRLRSPAPADGAGCTFNSPVGLFRLQQPGEWDLDRAQIYGLSFKAVEAI